MFWVNKGSEAIVEPFNKFKFIADFTTFQKSDTNPINGYGGEEPVNIRLAVKKIDLPKLNLEFERAYANEYVHYFQNGPINWEPINITFIDAGSTNFGQFTNMSYFFQTFIQGLTKELLTPSFTTFEQNRTGLVDSPALCEEIKITNFSRVANADYPTFNNDLINNEKLEKELLNRSRFGANIFVIKRPRIIKVDFGSMDYSSDDINEISITIVPEWCTLG